MTEYLKIPEIARRLDVSDMTIRRYIRRGELPSVFFGNAYRVTEEDLNAFVARGQAPHSQARGPRAPLLAMEDFRARGVYPTEAELSVANQKLEAALQIAEQGEEKGTMTLGDGPVSMERIDALIAFAASSGLLSQEYRRRLTEALRRQLGAAETEGAEGEETSGRAVPKPRPLA